MKILIIEWASFGKEDIDDAFIKSGHNIVKFSVSSRYTKQLSHASHCIYKRAMV